MRHSLHAGHADTPSCAAISSDQPSSTSRTWLEASAFAHELRAVAYFALLSVCDVRVD
jgi:hypothetical protein